MNGDRSGETAGSGAMAHESAAVDEVLGAARARGAALAAGDPARLGGLLHAQFRWTSHTGESFDKTSYVQANTGGRTVWRMQDLGDPRVIVVGGTAVLTTIVTDRVESATGPRDFRMPITQVWVDGDDGWRCLCGHAGPRLEG
jgi:hypothetical protein